MASVVVVGSGAVGSYYGALLARAGHDVRFVMRRDLEAVRERGLDIRSTGGDFRLANVSCFASAAEAGTADWVICSLKSTALGEARELIEPSVGPQTRILALMNGLGIEGAFAEWFGPERVFGGMAFVCINRGEPGVVHHLEYGRVNIGHYRDDAGQLAELHELLASGGIDVASAASLLQARWEKLCWNIPFNGLSVAAGGVGTRTILDDSELRATAERAMREVVHAGNADLAAHGAEGRIDEETTVERMFAQTESMGDYRTSMVIDYVMGRPLEVEAILGTPSRRAAELGVAAPTTGALYGLVRAADWRRRGLMAVLTVEDVEAPQPI